MTGLNNQQQRAVKILNRHLCIIAGPGTGKTKTLVSKIGYLYRRGVISEKIIALTFSNKAAKEIRERCKKMLTEKNLPFIGTVHSFAFNFLQQQGLKLTLLSTQQQSEIISGLLKQSCLKISDAEAITIISKHKNNTPNQELNSDILKLTRSYDIFLRKKGLIDYDDLLLKTIHLLNTQVSLDYSYVLVDEFQDINRLQYEIIKLISWKGKIFVIGDPLQSIYSFRGATPDIFSLAEKDFAGLKELTLNINYRSSQNIVSVTGTIFPHQPNLKPSTEELGKVWLVSTRDEYSEARWIVRNITGQMGGIDLNSTQDGSYPHGNRGFADFAVIYRAHFIKTQLENCFLNSGIPYQVVGGGSFFESKFFKTLTDCLYYLASPDDALKNNLLQNFSSGQLAGIKNFSQPLIKLLESITKMISTKIKLSQERQLQLREFINNSLRFDQGPEGLFQLIAYLDSQKENEFYDNQADKVTLLTMHAAKGLEFPFVYISGFEEGIIPYKKSVTTVEIEEEKRLLYVAMTRAKSELFLITPAFRMKKPTQVSSFAPFINQSFVEYIRDKSVAFKKSNKIKDNQLGLF